MQLLILRQGLRGFTQIDFALHDAVCRALAAVVAAVDEAAPINKITLARRYRQKWKPGIRLPEIEERAEVIGDIRLVQHAERRMRGLSIADGLGRWHESVGQFENSGGAK